MIKILGLVLLMLSSFLFGQLLASTLYKRKAFLQDFVSFLTTLQIRIRYSNCELKNLISQSMTQPMLKNNKDFIVNDGNQFNISWENSVEKIPKIYGLTKEDKKLLYEFGKGLGTTDVEGQIEHISLYITLFTNAFKNADENINKRSKLYRMSGLIIGAVTAIMMI